VNGRVLMRPPEGVDADGRHVSELASSER